MEWVGLVDCEFSQIAEVVAKGCGGFVLEAHGFFAGVKCVEEVAFGEGDEMLAVSWEVPPHSFCNTSQALIVGNSFDEKGFQATF